MRIARDFFNSLLKRRELAVVVENDSNPGFAKTKEEIAKEFNVNEDLVVVRKIESGFGTKEFAVDVFIYEDKEVMEKIEPKKKEKKEKK